MTRKAPAHIGRRTYQAAFTLLEVLLVIALVIILFLVAYDRLLPLLGEAESAHVAQVEGTLRSSLGLTVAEYAVQGRLEDLSGLHGSDPMALLSEPPDNYLGRLNDRTSLAYGHWAFDQGSGELLYSVRRPGFLSPPTERPLLLRWRIHVDPLVGVPRTVVLESIDGSPRWAKAAGAPALSPNRSDR